MSSTTTHLAKKIMEGKAILLDVRTHEEYAGYHIPGAINISVEELDHMIPIIEAWDRPVITYSGDDNRSALVANRLQRHGVVAIDGGRIEFVEMLLGLPSKRRPG